jgi:D-alanine-D-alanine ligase
MWNSYTPYYIKYIEDGLQSSKVLGNHCKIPRMTELTTTLIIHKISSIRQEQNLATKVKLNIDTDALKKIKLVAVAFSFVERENFPTESAFIAEKEVEERAQEVINEIKKLGLEARGYPADQYLLTNILVDKPDVIVNLVDTVRGKDKLSSTIPAFLEYANIPYTGCGVTGMVIGSNRHLFKELLIAGKIPTPEYKFVRDLRSNTPPSFEPPYIVKLNESGGSMGIDNRAVKETPAQLMKKVEELQTAYRIPVLVEKFIDGQEITAVVFEDGKTRHVFLARKKFKIKADGRHEFTSQESYDIPNAAKYELVDEELEKKVSDLCSKAFEALRFSDYAKFDIRVDETDLTPYFIDCNPNTALGPGDQPMTQVMKLHGIEFGDIMASLLSKHAKSPERPSEI